MFIQFFENLRKSGVPVSLREYLTFLEALSKVNIQLGNNSFIAVILGNDQGRDLYRKKLIRLVEQYRLTKQIRFIDHCKNMPLAYKISDIVVSTSIKFCIHLN